MPSEPRTLPTDFLTAHLPISGGAVRRLGVGTWQIGGVTTWGGRPTGWGPTDPDEALQALRYALERGFNFFDTADAYGRGRSEELLGRAIRESGVEQVVVCTKFGSREDDRGRFFLDFSPAWLQSAVESSLRRLGRERLDILLLHSPPDDFDWENYDPTPFEQLRQAGKIGAYGVSVKTLRGAERVLEAGFGQVIEAIYNMLDRRAEESVLPRCRARCVAFIARCPLASGFLSGKAPARFTPDDFRSAFPEAQNEWLRNAAEKLAQATASEQEPLPETALRFVLSHPAVSVAIPGVRRKPYVDSMLRALQKGPLNPKVLESIRRKVPTTYPGWM